MKRMQGFEWLVLLGLLVLTSCGGSFSSTELIEIRAKRFEEMVQSQEIEKLTLVNEEEVEVTLKPEALQSTAYLRELERNSAFGMSKGGPHYRMKIESIDRFVDYYDETTRNIPRENRIDLVFVERSDLGRVILNWVLVLIPLFGLIIWLLMRRKRSKEVPNDQQEQRGELVRREAGRYRYPALRIIAGIYMVCAWITVIVAIIVTSYQSSWFAVVSLGVGALVALGLASCSELIKVFLDIEYNTRKLADKD